MPEIGEEAESIITNSKHLASVIEKAACRSCEEVERAIAKEIKGPNWKSDVLGFEQHMKEEDEARTNWQRGGLEKDRMEFSACGDRNAWSRNTHVL